MKSVMLSCNTIPNVYTDITYPVLASGKLDGVRGIVYGHKLLSRSLKDTINRFVVSLLSRPEFEGLDGELTLKGESWNNFNENQSAFMTQNGHPDFTFHVFDDASHPGDAYERKRYAQYRVQELKEAGCTFIEFCEQHVVTSPDELRKLYDAHRNSGYEGLIVMSPRGKYKQGRSTLKQQISLKLKPCEDAEAKIVGFEELMHNMDAGNSKCKENLVPGGKLGALIVEMNGVQFNIGTGFDDYWRQHIWDNQAKYVHATVTFKYMEKFPSGIPRSPVFKGIRFAGDL